MANRLVTFEIRRVDFNRKYDIAWTDPDGRKCHQVFPLGSLEPFLLAILKVGESADALDDADHGSA